MFTQTVLFTITPNNFTPELCEYDQAGTQAAGASGHIGFASCNLAATGKC